MELICQKVFDLIVAVLSDRCLTSKQGNDQVVINTWLVLRVYISTTTQAYHYTIMASLSRNARILIQDNDESLQQSTHTITR